MYLLFSLKWKRKHIFLFLKFCFQLLVTECEGRLFNSAYVRRVGRVAVERLATGWRVRGSNPGGVRFSAPLQTGPVFHPASCTMGTVCFPGVKIGGGVTLTPHTLLVPRSWKGRQYLYKGDLYLYLFYKCVEIDILRTCRAIIFHLFCKRL